MKVSEVAASIVDECGVVDVFGLMGDGNLAFITFLTSELGVRFHSSRHESAAIGMADGYTRLRGDVGVCTVTQGPGLTNALTGLVTARKANTPLVLFVGDVPPAQAGWPQDADHHGLLQGAGVPVIDLVDPDTADRDVRRAFALARRASGPVAVNMPVDRQSLEWRAWDDQPESAAEPVREPVTPDGDSVARAAEILAAARRPLIVAGRGALRLGIGAELRRLGERSGALLATTLPAKGLFRGDPWDLGITGSLATGMAASLIGRADVVLAVGAALNDFTTMKKTVFDPAATVIRCDVDAAPRANRMTASVDVVGDGRLVVEALSDCLGDRSDPGYRTTQVAETIAGFDHGKEFVDQSGPDGMDPRTLVLELDRLLPADRTVVTDVGHFFGFPATYLSRVEAGRYLAVTDFGAVGAGIGAAMGAAIARPEATTVFFVGDGGLLMSLGDLETIGRLRLPVVVVVMNDAAYGSELHMLRAWKLETSAAEFPVTDFEPLAASFGIAARTVSTIEELAGLAPLLAEPNGPVLLDCRVTQRVQAEWLAGAFDR